MKLKKNSLTIKIWIYLSIFSIIILAFLWFFQIISLNGYYRYVKVKSLNKITSKITKKIDDPDYKDYLDNLSFSNEICIELYHNTNRIYQTNNKKDCIIDSYNHDIQDYKNNFYYSDLISSNFETINPRFNNKTLISGTKINNNITLFVTTSLVPLNSSIDILKQQLIYITILILILSFLISFFISKKISKPIIKISKAAKELPNGDYNIVFDTNTNIAEINDLTANLNYARDELGKTEELRRELLANVGHDLKTPLTMIKAYAEMAKLEITPFNITKLIKSIINRYNVLKITEGYNIIFDCHDDIMVEGDKKRIEQVIYNLINNAINYTGDNKKVVISITEHHLNYRISISDSGKGIAKKDLKLIWDKYYRIDKNYQRKAVGTGLGLSIVKNILIKHKSNYGVITSKKGTTFYFDLPKKQN